MSEQVHFEIDQNATFATTVVWTDADGVPIDITDYTVKMDLKDDYDSTEPIISLTNDSGITVTGATGTIDIEITDEQTAEFDFINCVYDLLVEDTDTAVHRIIYGTFTLNRGVTKIEEVTP